MRTCGRSLIAALVVLIVALPASALADGVAYERKAEAEPFRPLHQYEQDALIAHHNGVERMLIAINVEPEGAGSDAFWLFPVPGTPETVTVDLVDRFPWLRGKEVLSEARSAVRTWLWAGRGFVVNPFVAGFLLPALDSCVERASRDVLVHAAIEKHGLRAEIITAGSLDELAAYLQAKSVDVPREHLAGFGPYLNGDYVLIATHIVSMDQLREEFGDELEWRRPWRGGRWPGVYVTFPTEKPFYPMLPTSAYGDAATLVRITVLGSVEPRGDGPMLAKAGCSHLETWRFDPGQFPAGMLDGLVSDHHLLYTRVQFNCEASAFTSDLTFEPRPDLLSPYQLLVQSPAGPRLLGGVAILVLGYLSGGVCGLIFFKRWHPHAVYGLAGFLTCRLVATLAYRTPGKTFRHLPLCLAVAALAVAVGGAIGLLAGAGLGAALAAFIFAVSALLLPGWPHWRVDNTAGRRRYALTYLGIYLALSVPAEVILTATLRL